MSTTIQDCVSQSKLACLAGLTKHPEIGQDAKIAIKRIQAAK
jgi:hypothetical protein